MFAFYCNLRDYLLMMLLKCIQPTSSVRMTGTNVVRGIQTGSWEPDLHHFF